MSNEEMKLRLRILLELIRVSFNMVVKPSLYMIVMWSLETAAAFLFFQDFWRAAGFVSALTLYQITQHEFTKEFFGPGKNAIQKQSQR